MRHQIDIRDFGAVSGGDTLNTKAIQDAIDECERRGGGVVHISPGCFLTGTLQLKSRVRLHLENGAVLKASGSMQDYRKNPFHHNEWKEVYSLLWAMNEESIVIDGSGTIDLNDSPFMKWDEVKVGEGFESEIAARLDERQRAEAAVEPRSERPNQCLFFQNIRGLAVRDITIRRAPCWALCVHSSQDIKITGLSIHNDRQVPNSDGIHLCSCTDAIIAGCVLHCGDDCVAITGITDWERPADSIVIANCTMSSSSAAVRLGHLASKVRNVSISNLVIRDSQRGIGIFAGEGGWVENVQISQIAVQTRLICGHWWGNGEPVVLSAPEGGRIREVDLCRIRAQSENGFLIFGHKGNISEVEMQDVNIALRAGRNRPLLGRWLDLQPAGLRQAPPSANAIPWLYLRETGRIGITRVRHSAAETDAGFSTDADRDCSPVSFS